MVTSISPKSVNLLIIYNMHLFDYNLTTKKRRWKKNSLGSVAEIEWRHWSLEVQCPGDSAPLLEVQSE